MTQVIDAVYEKGAFRPLVAIEPALAEGQQVRVTVETDTTNMILALAASVYDGLSKDDIADVERIALDRSSFFMGSN
jgi:predicted DNA-binding antitoxin AbrB/MazE fold protein